jgi:hypothetical protein
MVDVKTKNELIKKIKQLNNREIINDIYRLLDIDTDEDIYITNKGQKERINKALAQIDNGKTVSEEESNHNIDKCLKRKK